MESCPVETLGRWIVRYRLAVTLAACLLSLGAVGVVAYRCRDGLPIDLSPRSLFVKDKKSRRLLAIEEQWGRDDNELIVIVEGPIFTAEGVRLLLLLHEAAAADPAVGRVESLASVLVLPDRHTTLLAARAEGQAPDPEALRKYVAAERRLNGWLVGRGGDIALVRARLAGELSLQEAAPVLRRLEEAVRGEPVPPGFNVSVAGIPYLQTQFVEMLRRDQRLFVPLIFGLFVALLLVIFRHPLIALVPLVTAGLVSLWAVGVLLLPGGKFNVLSVLVPTLIPVFIMPDAIHLTYRYRQELAADGDREAAMGRVLRFVGLACFLTSFTTMLAFASFVVTDNQLLQEFGIHFTVATFVGYVVVLFVIPVGLSWLPVRLAAARPEGDQNGPAAGLVSRAVGAFVGGYTRWADAVTSRWPGRLVVVGAGLGLAAALCCVSLRTRNHPLEMFPSDHPVVRTYQRVSAKLGGIVPVFVHLEAPSSGSLLDPANLRRLAQLQASIAADPDIDWALSVADLLRAAHQRAGGSDDLPSSSFLARWEVSVLRARLRQLGQEHLLTALLRDNGRQARVVAMTAGNQGTDFLALAERIEALGNEAFAGTDVTVTAAGVGIRNSRAVRGVVADLLLSVVTTALTVLATLLLVFRNVRFALLLMVPNVLPVTFTLAGITLLGGAIRLNNVFAFAIVLGLAFDNTVHFVARLGREFRLAPDPHQAVRATLHSIGPAMIYTNTLLLLNLLVLLFGSVVSTVNFGLLSASTLAGAQVCDLFLLPALFHCAPGVLRQVYPQSDVPPRPAAADPALPGEPRPVVGPAHFPP
jgi:predicted RND superfamily exporter protein